MRIRARTRERATRRILSALMDSDLSIVELKELSQAMRDREFMNDLGRMLLEVVEKLDSDDEVRSSSRDVKLENVLQEIKRRRLTKAEVILLISAASPQFGIFDEQEATLKELVRRFFDRASNAEVHALTKLIGTPIKEDPYLKGITEGG